MNHRIVNYNGPEGWFFWSGSSCSSVSWYLTVLVALCMSQPLMFAAVNTGKANKTKGLFNSDVVLSAWELIAWAVRDLDLLLSAFVFRNRNHCRPGWGYEAIVGCDWCSAGSCLLQGGAFPAVHNSFHTRGAEGRWLWISSLDQKWHPRNPRSVPGQGQP